MRDANHGARVVVFGSVGIVLVRVLAVALALKNFGPVEQTGRVHVKATPFPSLRDKDGPGQVVGFFEVEGEKTIAAIGRGGW